MKHFSLRAALLFLLLSAIALAQDVASFEKRVTVKKLANGLTVIICERPEAPVFSFYTLVDAGSVQDPMLATGLAHMFEHMAFKGTDKIGTKDYAAEKPVLAKVEVAYAAYLTERDKSVGQDPAKLEQLALIEEAELRVLGEFLEKMKTSDEGETNLLDQTAIFYASNLGNSSSHDNTNLPILLAGGGFKHQGHVAYDRKNNKLCSNLFVRMIQQMDIEMDKFGASDGVLSEV